MFNMGTFKVMLLNAKPKSSSLGKDIDSNLFA